MPELNSSSSRPALVTERIDFVDILRGFALLGVIISNIFDFNTPPHADFFIDYAPENIFNIIFFWIVQVFVVGKFYLIFSFLFGLSFVLQIDRLKERATKLTPIYLRRLAILLLFGIAHSIFLWAGDILKFYATFGFILFLFRNAKPKTLLKWSLTLLFIAYIGLSSASIISTVIKKDQDPQQVTNSKTNQENQKKARYRELYSQGNYSAVTKERIKILYSDDNLALLFMGLFFVLPIFLMGGYFGRRKLFHKLTENQFIFKKLFRWSLPLAILISTCFIIFGQIPSEKRTVERMLRVISEILSSPFMALLLVSGLAILYTRKSWSKLLQPLAYLGRMALTNYLLQSIIFSMIFYGYGLGFLGNKSMPLMFALAIAIYIIQIWFSRWWLTRFRFGPAEWLWRSLTYLKRQPMKKNH